MTIAAHARRALAVFDVRLVFLGEVAQCAQHRVGGRYTQPAQAGVPQEIAEVLDHGDILLAGLETSDLGEQFVHLVSSHAARNTLAAGLSHAEVHEVLGHVDHAGTVVHHDHSAGTHDGTDPGQRFVIDRHIEKFRRDATAGRPAGLHRLILTAVGNATADLEDDLAQGDAHGDFHQPGIFHASSKGKYLGALALFATDLGVPFSAVSDNRWDVGVGLNVVDQRGLPEQSLLGGIRRTRTGRASLPLHRRYQRIFFPAHKCPSSQPNFYSKTKTGPKNVVAQQA